MMKKNRLEAFSDGVIAIIITIMVLEMKIPHGDDWAALKPLIPVFLSYVLSFIYVGLYWNNHHHLWQIVDRVNGSVLWANLHLLFWLSLFPFATGWLGENHFAMWPTALYGFVLFMAAIAWFILARTLIRLHGKDSPIAEAYGRDWKGKLPLLIYTSGIILAFWNTWVSQALYTLVAALWIIPDRRIERELNH
ncbi:TMEM175 family protein [Compostibacter hankyongensis]|uniref:TMEM175 family protein n=1 Tax=Compostibacter hankyongensis TaxID=1007089 RepID=A0ABP8FXZ6_9BACT